jgi:hypothetical protein
MFCQFNRVPFQLRTGSLRAKLQTPLRGYSAAHGHRVSLPMLASIFAFGFGGATQSSASGSSLVTIETLELSQYNTTSIIGYLVSLCVKNELNSDSSVQLGVHVLPR